MVEDSGKISLLTAIVPIRPSLDDLRNVFGWLEKEQTAHIHFVLILDRPTSTMLKVWAEFYADFKVRADAPQVDVIDGDFGGPGPARNAGLAHIDTQYVAFWDSDDHPNIPQIMKYLMSIKLQQPKLVVGSFEVIRQGGEKQTIHTYDLLQLARNPGLWRCLIPFESLGEIKFPNIVLGEDQVFLARIMAGCPPVEYSEIIFYSYMYGNSGQLTANKDFSDLVKAESLVTRIDVDNTNRNERDFIYNLSTKQLLTVLLRGQLRMKFISATRMVRKFVFNSYKFSKSLMDLIINTSKDRFNG